MSTAIDWNLSLELANNNSALATDLLGMFMAELPETVALLNNYFDQKDWESLQAQVHKLHGGACYVGVPALKETAKQLESILKSENFEVLVDGAFRELLDCIQRVNTSYEQGNYKQ